jgi:outer membrane biogenesis lipoprotein LolB
MKKLVGFIVLALVAAVVISCASQTPNNPQQAPMKDVR